jgi:putative lipoprotein
MTQDQPFWPFLSLTFFLMIAVSVAAIAGELAGSEWRPTRIGSSNPPSKSKLFVQFKGDGKLTGHGGCNRFFGQYKISGNEITIGPVGATRMACLRPVIDLEMALFTALESAKTYRKDKTNLVLMDATGKEQLRLIQTDRD